MKILFYTYTLKASSGGALDAMLILINAFVARGYDVSLAIHSRTDTDVRVPCDVFVLNARFGDLTRPFSLAALVRRLKPDLVFSDMKPQNMNASIAKFLLGKTQTRFVGVERNPDFWFKYSKKSPFIRRLLGKAYKNLDLMLAVSKAVALDLQKTFSVDSGVIYDAIDEQKILALKDEPLSQQEQKIFEKQVIINVGRLTPQKGQDLLLESFAALGGDYHLLIIGDGDLKESLEKKAKDLGVRERVFFAGYKANPYKYMARASVFALTSHYEGFGKVVLESLFLGVPAVAFDSVGGHNEILALGGGFLAPYKDTKRFAQILKSVLADGGTRADLAPKILATVEKFSLSSHLEQFESLFKTLCAGQDLR